MEKFKQWIVSHKLVLIIIASILVVSVALAVVLPITLSNRHTFSEDWSVSATHHWHSCVEEGCNKTNGKSEHDFDAARKCKVCQKTEFILELDPGDTPRSLDNGFFQIDWIVEHSGDSEYVDYSIYTCEYFKYSADRSTLTSIGKARPTEAGEYMVKVIFDGDEIYLPTEATTDFTIVE